MAYGAGNDTSCADFKAWIAARTLFLTLQLLIRNLRKQIKNC